MPWTYSQSTGELKHNGKFIVKGYSGKGLGKDNPKMESVSNIGPIPKGKYTMIDLIQRHPHTGAYSIRLQPAPYNKMHGRSGFLIHGDSIKNPGTASNGCIILDRIYREQMWNSNDKQVEVIE
ncbi:tlde1 domain-containing protein [Snodgrassella alvi]|uniref:tlde1 domain-containing protein n=1 Tax=Snodgrassella alvi TaxID=1196083 RepID=UPI000C1E9A90|nr:tlde1 domain-containing protein [Snodgrassella alvi]PIT17208.1 DUF2778 domain-containing protein [Snodgrassella alvi]PIT17606.1 DUF2778 domain-containing protein [Snodgrassella alvi]PIT28364.1 DUF2778 domain-containing protein [Snodgrassella alvi]